MPVVQGENKSQMDIEHGNPRQENEDSSNHEPEQSNLQPKSNSELARSKPMKRREINEEKKEMTALFADLISMINAHVLRVTGTVTISQEPAVKKAKVVAPQPELKRKNTKNNKNIKEAAMQLKQLEREKSCAESQQTPLPYSKPNNSEIPRKNSSLHAPANNPNQNVELIQKKKQLFQNYPQMMSYKIHQFVPTARVARPVEEQQISGQTDKNLIPAKKGSQEHENTSKKNQLPLPSDNISSNQNKIQNSEQKRKFSIARSVEMVIFMPVTKAHVDSGCGVDQVNIGLYPKQNQMDIELKDPLSQPDKDEKKEGQVLNTIIIKEVQDEIQDHAQIKAAVNIEQNKQVSQNQRSKSDMVDEQEEREEEESLPRYTLKNDLHIDAMMLPASLGSPDLEKMDIEEPNNPAQEKNAENKEQKLVGKSAKDIQEGEIDEQ